MKLRVTHSCMCGKIFKKSIHYFSPTPLPSIQRYKTLHLAYVDFNIGKIGGEHGVEDLAEESPNQRQLLDLL